MDNKIIIQKKESIHHTSLGECQIHHFKDTFWWQKTHDKECSLCGNGTLFYYCCYYSVLLTKISFGGQFDNLPRYQIGAEMIWIKRVNGTSKIKVVPKNMCIL